MGSVVDCGWDRLLHHAHVSQIKAENYRPKDNRKAVIIGTHPSVDISQVGHFKVAVDISRPLGLSATARVEIPMSI